MFCLLAMISSRLAEFILAFVILIYGSIAIIVWKNIEPQTVWLGYGW